MTNSYVITDITCDAGSAGTVDGVTGDV